jgi:hypothetical protein
MCLGWVFGFVALAVVCVGALGLVLAGEVRPAGLLVIPSAIGGAFILTWVKRRGAREEELLLIDFVARTIGSGAGPPVA